MMSISAFLFVAALALVIFSLMGGLVAMVRGRPQDAIVSNRFMRLRVASQALAIAMLLLAAALA